MELVRKLGLERRGSAGDRGHAADQRNRPCRRIEGTTARRRDPLGGEAKLLVGRKPAPRVAEADDELRAVAEEAILTDEQ